jgi:NAD(P)-dependent dehydrogenase (short-subunit alcohol dehydrogenase family)
VDETGPVDILVNNAGGTQLSQTFRSSGYDEALKSLEMFESRMAGFARVIRVRRTLRPADLAVRARAARYLT